jgi:NifU-like protein involved in Fe-S cluster formation
MYNEKVLRIFQDPPNVGRILKADGVGEVGNTACGDVMKIYLRVGKGEVIEDAKFQTFGCAVAIAASSMGCTMIKGLTLDEAAKLKNSDILAELGTLPPQKTHCSILAQQAISAAIADYRKNNSKKKYNESEK